MQFSGIISALKTTYWGMATQLQRLKVVSSNIAHAEDIADDKGKVYHRQRVIEQTPNSMNGRVSFGETLRLRLRRTNPNHITNSHFKTETGLNPNGKPFKVIQIPGYKLVHDPSNPNADENGNVKMANINLLEEMVELIAASRAYDANVNVLNAAKLTAKRTLQALG